MKFSVLISFAYLFLIPFLTSYSCLFAKKSKTENAVLNAERDFVPNENPDSSPPP